MISADEARELTIEGRGDPEESKKLFRDRTISALNDILEDTQQRIEITAREGISTFVRTREFSTAEWLFEMSDKIVSSALIDAGFDVERVEGFPLGSKAYMVSWECEGEK